MDLSTAKILGIIGAVLNFVGWFTQPVVSIVGFILVLLAIYTVSSITKRSEIFTNYLIGVILTIAGIVILVIGLMYLGISMMASPTIIFNMPDLSSIIFAIIALVIIFVVLFIIGSYFIRKAYHGMGDTLNHGLFRTTGTLYFISAILSIILIGILLLFATIIVELVAWATMPTTLPKPLEEKGLETPEEKPPEIIL
ncbi:MAG: hypothetical protein B6U89_05985 [Desulfurococcales archaeon ex4484_58]|nr:MAG: hypothetical protein B6U89_05985 [Desulfurococcales archaeon ex4484_58]